MSHRQDTLSTQRQPSNMMEGFFDLAALVKTQHPLSKPHFLAVCKHRTVSLPSPQVQCETGKLMPGWKVPVSRS